MSWETGERREGDDGKTLQKLIHGIHVAMLTTVEADGSLHSRPMAALHDSKNDEGGDGGDGGGGGGGADGELWFFTGAGSAKAGEVARDGRVNVSFADPGDGRFVSVSGSARVVRDRARAERLWTPAAKAWFPRGLDDPDLALLRVAVERAEFWDAPAGKMVQLAGMLKAIATGERYHASPGEHGTLTPSGDKS